MNLVVDEDRYDGEEVEVCTPSPRRTKRVSSVEGEKWFDGLISSRLPTCIVFLQTEVKKHKAGKGDQSPVSCICYAPCQPAGQSMLQITQVESKSMRFCNTL
jgi:hypothetical protein